MDLTWWSYGTPGMSLEPTVDGVRTAYNGTPGAWPYYARWSSNETVVPPYVFSGRVKVRKRLDPLIIGGQPVGYDHRLVFHPTSMPAAPGGVNDNNISIAIGATTVPRVSVKAELVVDGVHRYGFRTGVDKLFQAPTPNPVDGLWHTFRIEMAAYGVYRMRWDGTLVADVVERVPASMVGRLAVGLRTDGYDAEFADMRVEGGGVKRYLTDLADVLRAEGLNVVEVPGWQTRARGSGGYDSGLPSHIMVHHTASPASTDGQRDVDYIVNGSPVAPIANLYTQRDGTVWVCAAGATNTNGKGADTWGGGVPNDSMNVCAISNEIANNGVGEPYPLAQQESVLRSTAALCRHYGIAPHFVRAHFEWSPGRKIDPSGPSKWALYGGMWNMTAFRYDVSRAVTPPPPPTPDPLEEIEMIVLDHNPGTPEWTALCWTGVELSHIFNGHSDAVLRRAGVPRQTVVDSELDAIIASSTTKTKCPPAWVNTSRGAAWTAQRG